MAKYMQDSTDIQINEVSGTDNINFSFKSGNSLSQEINNINTKIGDLTQLNTTNKGSIVNSINEVNNKFNYSTEEQVIGKWTNGKPIYRKVLNVGTVTTQKTCITHNIANLGKLVNLYGTLNRNDNVQQIIPGNYTNWEIYLYDVSSIELTINFSANQWSRNPHDIVIIMEYTKTTD